MVYIDSNIFVFAAIIQQSDEKALQAAALLTKIAEKRIDASTSVLTWDELVWVCRKILPPNESLEKGKAFLDFPNLKIADATSAIAHKAGQIMSKYALMPRDALHAATAILAGEKAIISDDADFDRISELERIPLSEAGSGSGHPKAF